MAGDKPRQPEYEIFSTKRRFQQSKSQPEEYPLKVVILPLLARVAWKRLQIGTDMLLIITSNSDKLFISVNVDDLEWPWTPKIGVFSEFF